MLHLRPALAALLIAPLLFACSARPHAASSNLRLDEHEKRQNQILSDSDRAAIRASFASLVAEHQPVSPPRPAVHGVRWSDVQLAAYYASMDVEMAIMRTTRRDDRLVFTLRSANERTGELIVRRIEDDRVYEATATIGVFQDDEATQRLLDAFDKRMRGFGAKRHWSD